MNRSLFDNPNDNSEEAGRRLRDQGVQACLDADFAPHRSLREIVEAVLDEFIARRTWFGADDVRRRIPADDLQRMSPNLVPSCFSHYARHGRIKQVGWTRSTFKTRHAGSQRLWVGADVTEIEAA